MRRRLALALLGITASGSLFAGVGVWTTNSSAYPVYGQVVIDPQGTVYAGTGNGIIKTSDNGRTWSSVPFDDLNGRGLAPLAAGPPGTIYAQLVTVVGPNATLQDVKTVDGGNHWSDLAISSKTIVLDPTNHGIVYSFGDPIPKPYLPLFDTLRRSTDGGGTWSEIDQGLGLGHTAVSAFAIDPKSPSTLYVSTYDAVSGGISIFKSIDSGQSWTLLTDQILGALLVVDPLSPSTIYSSGNGGEIFKSIDGGHTFAVINAGFTNGGGLSSFVIDPVHTNRLFAADTLQGVFQSLDSGSTWIPINAGLTGNALRVFSVAIDPTGTDLHAITQDPGVRDYQVISTTGALILDASHPFTITLAATDPRTGQAAPGVPTQGNDLWGYFSIPAITGNPDNPEVFVKLLDGTAINGEYWFFYGGLTDLEYTLTVTDVTTGKQKTYTKPANSECGGSDTEAFGP